MITKEELKAMRKKHDLTQTQIAALVFKSKMAWSYYESGKRQMSKGTYELLKIKLKED